MQIGNSVKRLACELYFRALWDERTPEGSISRSEAVASHWLPQVFSILRRVPFSFWSPSSVSDLMEEEDN